VPATFVLFEDIVAPGGTIAQVGVHGVKADLYLERLWSQNITIATRLGATQLGRGEGGSASGSECIGYPRIRRFGPVQTGAAARTGFDDRRAQVYRAPSQAGPGQ
jgi:hypothetical protein